MDVIGCGTRPGGSLEQDSKKGGHTRKVKGSSLDPGLESRPRAGIPKRAECQAREFESGELFKLKN